MTKEEDHQIPSANMREECPADGALVRWLVLFYNACDATAAAGARRTQTDNLNETRIVGRGPRFCLVKQMLLWLAESSSRDSQEKI